MNSTLLIQSMSVINEELQSLRSEALALQGVYSEAAASSDLTFIKIIEQKYGDLTDAVSKLDELVSEAKLGLTDYVMEGTVNGR